MAPIKTASREGIERMMHSLGLTKAMQRAASEYRSVAQDAVQIAAASYLQHLQSSVADIKPTVVEHGAKITAAEVDHVALLFATELDEGYVASLNDSATKPYSDSLGARVRLGTSVRMIDVLFNEAAKRNRFSARKTAKDCLALAKLLLADALAASVCHQKTARASLSDKRRELEAQSEVFRDEIASLAEALLESAGRLKSNSSASIMNSTTADECAAAAEGAARECVRIVDETFRLSGAFRDALVQVDEEANRSAAVTNQAVEGGRAISAVIETLANAAQQVESVVSLIANIASQTNLLALNATIEAARAGAVGKGFAVVASEVKALSQQTGEAASIIASQIKNMQAVTKASVDQVNAIGETIQRLKASSGLIKETVRGQTAGTLSILQQSAKAAQHSKNGFVAASEARAAIGTVVALATDVDEAVLDVERAASDVGRAADLFVTRLRKV